MAQVQVSVYLCLLLRHHPELIDLEMDKHGWVSVDDLITNMNEKGEHKITFEQLEEIVRTDNKGRYRFNEDKSKIKACQGHSLTWVEPELEYLPPPKYLYHGTTVIAAKKIYESGAISKMSRHAVHTQEDPYKAWQSAIRWHLNPVVLKIDAEAMHLAGYTFGKSENDVWCTDHVPVSFITEKIHDPKMFSRHNQ